MIGAVRAPWELVTRVAGVDEAGRGSLAGPVVAGAVILPPGAAIPGLADSKVLAPATREALYEAIRARALAVGVGVVGPEAIDATDILRASLLAMARAVEVLDPPPEFLLVDGLHRPPVRVRAAAIPHGDRLFPAISAASIVAKVTRDRIMADLGATMPEYGFDAHKGYGTPAHRRALARFGPSPVHRRSFAGVREYLGAARPAQGAFPGWTEAPGRPLR